MKGDCCALIVAEGGFNWVKLVARCMEGDRGVKILRGARSPRALAIDMGDAAVSPWLAGAGPESFVAGGGRKVAVGPEPSIICDALRRRPSPTASLVSTGFRIEATPAEREAGEKLPPEILGNRGNGGSSTGRRWIDDCRLAVLEPGADALVYDGRG